MANANAPEGEGVVSDAVRGNWVDTRAPESWRPYLRMSRMDRPIGTWLLLIPCWWGLALAILSTGFHGWSDLWIAFVAALGALLMRGAGCTWNDITDRDLDAQVSRTRSRPLPSGQITLKQAMIWMGVQVAISALLLFTLNAAAIVLGIVALVPVAIYPFAKRFTWWPQVFLGIAFNWGALLCWAAHTGSLSLAPVLLYLAGIAWTLFYDTIYAHQDAEDDALIGIKSTARLFGENSPRMLVGFAITSALLFAAAIIAAFTPAGYLPLVVSLVGVIGFAAHMAWQIRQFDADDSAVLLRLFRSNRDAGLIPLIFLLIAAAI